MTTAFAFIQKLKTDNQSTACFRRPTDDEAARDAALRAKALERFRRLRKQYENAPDVGGIFGLAPKVK